MSVACHQSTSNQRECSAQSEHLRYSPNSCNVALELFFSHFLFFFFVDQFYSDPFVSQVYHLFPHFVFIWYHFSFPFLTKCWPISASRGCLRWKCFAHSAVSGRWEPCPGYRGSRYSWTLDTNPSMPSLLKPGDYCNFQESLHTEGMLKVEKPNQIVVRMSNSPQTFMCRQKLG